MEYTNELIAGYAKKIYGFAYSKTKNYHDAEDLSQDIISALCDKRISNKNIQNMDSFVYRVCCYTWSKFLRKNKPKWEELNNESALDFFSSAEDIEYDFLQRELYEKLRQEIMFLSRMKREITVMFYYENKTGDEIAKILNIPASTVRWNLSQVRINLKERIEMKEQSIHKPIRLYIGHNGWVHNYDMNGLQSDKLMQNICWICYGNSLTIEEIARTLGVAAVYLEDKIDKLLYMDYIKKVGANKFQTNFFIRDIAYHFATQKFMYENTLTIALQYYNTLKKCFDEIKRIGFIGCDLNDNFLIWSLLPILINDSTYSASAKVASEKKLCFARPIRKDGSEHWVCASVPIQDMLESNPDISDDFKDFCLNGGGNGIKTRNTDKLHSLQYDLSFAGEWRDFDAAELSQLKRVKEIIENKEIPNSYDKEIISNLVSKGYVKVNDNIPEILIPFFTGAQFNAIKEILKKTVAATVEEDVILKPFRDYVEVIKKFIPSFVDVNERNYLLSTYWPQYAILWLLMKNNYLSEPTEEEKKRLCTVVWED